MPKNSQPEIRFRQCPLYDICDNVLLIFAENIFLHKFCILRYRKIAVQVAFIFRRITFTKGQTCIDPRGIQGQCSYIFESISGNVPINAGAPGGAAQGTNTPPAFVDPYRCK